MTGAGGTGNGAEVEKEAEEAKEAREATEVKEAGAAGLAKLAGKATGWAEVETGGSAAVCVDEAAHARMMSTSASTKALRLGGVTISAASWLARSGPAEHRSQ